MILLLQFGLCSVFLLMTILGGNEKKSDEDINNMMNTFLWNSNYRKYIRMYLKSAPDIIRNLKQW